MFTTNLKIFIWNFVKHKLFTGINIGGLSIGFASCLMIFLYVIDEFSYDSLHPDAARIYRISSFLVEAEQGKRMPIPSASPRVGPLLQENFPEVDAFTRIAEEPIYLSLDDNRHREDEIRFVDRNFFRFFQFDWLQGEAEAALAEPDSIVLTESLAKKYFGTENPMGRFLLLQNGKQLKVTGLIRDLQNTHLSGKAFITMSTLESLIGASAMESWFGARFQNYVRLQEGVVFERLRPLFHDFLENQMPSAAKALYDPDSTALRDIHLSAPQSLGLGNSSKRQEVLSLLLVCVALLAIACFNFINLSTAISSQRVKEIAMRKVMGARRGQIFLQHMGESTLLMLFSLLLGLGIAELALPILNDFSGKQLNLLGTSSLLFATLALGLMVILLSGIYPSLYLSALMPAGLLKSSENKNAAFRDLLVVLQFAIAIVLIVATTVLYLQVQYGKRIDLGFNKDQVLVLDNTLGESWPLLKEGILKQPGVTHVSGAMNPPFKAITTGITARYEGGAPEGENLPFFMVDFDYFELFDVEFMAGRGFSESFGSDRQIQPTKENPHPGAALVLNRSMVENLGWNPETALGRRIELNWSQDYSLSVMGEVVGVIEDMRTDSLRREVTPLLYMVPSSVAGLDYGLVKISTTSISATLQEVDALWESIYPDQPISRYFLDTAFQSLYEEEEKQASLLAVFSLLAIIIACLGLFGLATFTIHRRTKEIGIRKVVGGNAWRIVLLFTNDFSKLVLISNLIAWPVAYFAMNRWLENFAYRIDLTPVIFIGSGLIALSIAWVTVGGTAAKAASRKPVLALRYE